MRDAAGKAAQRLEVPRMLELILERLFVFACFVEGAQVKEHDHLAPMILQGGHSHAHWAREPGSDG